jgi:hypothetical protein
VQCGGSCAIWPLQIPPLRAGTKAEWLAGKVLNRRTEEREEQSPLRSSFLLLIPEPGSAMRVLRSKNSSSGFVETTTATEIVIAICVLNCQASVREVQLFGARTRYVVPHHYHVLYRFAT